jgi:acyl-CoA ligase (AMP-forming) (exosortase A-associated)
MPSENTSELHNDARQRAMIEATLLHELIELSAERLGTRTALTFAGESIDYRSLHQTVLAFAAGLGSLGLAKSDRVGVCLDKRLETVAAMFGAAAAGGVFVPLNPLLKPAQVAYILRDCNVRVLLTSHERVVLLEQALAGCSDLRHLIVIDAATPSASLAGKPVHLWKNILAVGAHRRHRMIDTDMASILYTSGSTGRPKGVVLSHRNMVAGAKSVASYLKNTSDDTLLAALPLSFDAGFSQLSTAFHVGARVVLINYLLPKDVTNAMARERVTGLTAVPPLYIQLSQIEWPKSIAEHLRYFANTGGRMPLDTLKTLRAKVPNSRPYLMYGLTEAFRSTYLPPDEVDRRPDSIGKAIPNAEILVLRKDGTRCAPNEPGELVHRGALVAMGYWNDPEKTAERFRPLPGREAGLVLPEIAVFSGDTVRMDEEGFLYFIGRSDEMIKTSGYRVSPTEIEEVLYGTQLVGEAAAFGVPHPSLGQGIITVVTPKDGVSIDEARLISACRERLPAFMVPAKVEIRQGPLPRNPNGKIDRKRLSADFGDIFATTKP